MDDVEYTKADIFIHQLNLADRHNICLCNPCHEREQAAKIIQQLHRSFFQNNYVKSKYKPAFLKNDMDEEKTQEKNVKNKHKYIVDDDFKKHLRGETELSGSIIDGYMELITQRSVENSGYNKVFAFSTYFYEKYLRSGHKGVKRWTKNLNLWEFDIILMPVHIQITEKKAHWSLAVIDFRKRALFYYDSLEDQIEKSENCLEILQEYLEHEFSDKHGKELNIEYPRINVNNIPWQQNNYDCGVFLCKFAEFITRDASISFSQMEMPDFRQQMERELCNGVLDSGFVHLTLSQQYY